jgi:hypothetical protein
LCFKFTKCAAFISANHTGLFSTLPNKMCRKPLLTLSRIPSFLSMLQFLFQVPGILAFGNLVGLLGSRETNLSILVEVWATDILIGRSTVLWSVSLLVLRGRTIFSVGRGGRAVTPHREGETGLLYLGLSFRRFYNSSSSTRILWAIMWWVPNALLPSAMVAVDNSVYSMKLL